MNLLNASCEMCAYLVVTGDNKGECRRYPPSVYIPNTDTLFFFPVVHFSDKCGEFEEEK